MKESYMILHNRFIIIFVIILISTNNTIQSVITKKRQDLTKEEAISYKPPLQLLPLPEGIKKINDKLYIGKKNDLYFVIERINEKTNRIWLDYIQVQKNKLRNATLSSEIIKSYNETFAPFIDIIMNFYDSDDVWVAFVTEKPIIQNQEMILPNDNIIMAVTVTTNKNIPFSTHMGIFRAIEFLQSKHKNLAINLHSFSAQVIRSLYGVMYMITKPVNFMRNMMIQNLPKKVWIGSAKEIEDIRIKKIAFDAYMKDHENLDNIYKFSMTFPKFGWESQFFELNQTEEVINNINQFYDDFIKGNFESIRSSKLKQKIKNFLENNVLNNTSLNSGKENLLKFLNNNLNELKTNIKALSKDYYLNDTKEEITEEFKLYFPWGDSGEPAPFQKILDDNMMLLDKSGKKIIFKAPDFYYHLLDAVLTKTPPVVIDIDALAEFLTLDKF